MTDLRRIKWIHRLKQSLLRIFIIRCSKLHNKLWWNYNIPLTEYQVRYFAWRNYFQHKKAKYPCIHWCPTNPQHIRISCTWIRTWSNLIQNILIRIYKRNGIIKWQIKTSVSYPNYQFHRELQSYRKFGKRRGKWISLQEKLEMTMPAWIFMGQVWN